MDKQIKNEEDAIKKLNGQIAAEEQKQAKAEKQQNISRSIINTAVAVTKALPNLILAGIVGALGIAETAKIAAQPLNEGGVVGLGDLIDVVTGQKISRGVDVGPLPGGDNVLVAAKKGEVILNEQQQAALGGAETFRRLGVKGFNDGGMVGGVIGAPVVMGGGS